MYGYGRTGIRNEPKTTVGKPCVNPLRILHTSTTSDYHPNPSRLHNYEPHARAAERMGGAQGKCKKRGPQYRLCKGGLGVCPNKNFEVLHALRCVLGASEAPFCACNSTYVPNLPSSFSCFRSKSIRRTRGSFFFQPNRSAK